MIDDVINNEQYKCLQKDKEKRLLDILKPQIEKIRNNEYINAMYNKLGVDEKIINSLEEIPFIPVNMFKYFDLITCNTDDIIRVLNSSSTTGNTPSRIYIDKETSIRQSKGLISILTSFLGSHRRPMLVIDNKEINEKNDTITARGAAIRGISSFGKSLTYIMDMEEGNLVVNFSRLKEFEDKYKDADILIYGFTYIIWTIFIKALKDKGIKLNMPKIKLLHSGGWKKLNDQKVEKEEFNNTVAEVLGTAPENIIDFYGMVEQLGVVFIDCEYGYKHVPDFGEIIIRDFSTLKEVKEGQCGFIEVISSLTSSYPGQAILTEDVGEFIGIDDCKCGRKGKYFKFKNRVEKSETRGCGDTFAEKRDNK